MKKVLNIIGYISLIAIPYFLATFIFVYHNLVKILVLITLCIIICFQTIHYRKTKIKNFGIRIFITIISIAILGSIIHYGYGMIKNNQAKELAKTIEKISIEGHEISKKEIENNLKFVNEKSLIYKGSSEAIIYYANGTIEKITAYYPGFYIIEINGDRYYINVLNNWKEKIIGQ